MWPKGAPYVMVTNVTWINRETLEQPLTLADILIIAPYHARVFELSRWTPGPSVGG
jgi:uncharacterized protein